MSLIKRYQSIVKSTECWHLDIYFDRIEFYLETTGKPRIDDKSYTPTELAKSKSVLRRLVSMYGLNSIIELCRLSNFSPEEIFEIRWHITEKTYLSGETTEYDFFNLICRNDQVVAAYKYKTDYERGEYETHLASDFRTNLKLRAEIEKLFGSDCLQNTLNLFDATFSTTPLESKLLSQPELVESSLMSTDCKWGLEICKTGCYVTSLDNSTTYYSNSRYFHKNLAEVKLIQDLFGSAALKEIKRIFDKK